MQKALLRVTFELPDNKTFQFYLHQSPLVQLVGSCSASTYRHTGKVVRMTGTEGKRGLRKVKKNTEIFYY